MSETVTIADFQERTKRALESDAPEIYFNGFVNNLGTSDILVILERNGKPVAKLNLSYTMAKSLGIALLHTVAQFEETVGRPMLTSQEIEAAMLAQNGTPQ